MKRHALALAGATVLLIAVPWFVLSQQPAVPPRAIAIDDRPLLPRPAAAIDTLLVREPFRTGGAVPPEDQAGEASEESDDQGGPPRVVGIVGRLPDRAIVLVRRPAGGTRTLAVGEAMGGWRLESIAADAALFSDGARRVRVELPIAEAAQ